MLLVTALRSIPNFIVQPTEGSLKTIQTAHTPCKFYQGGQECGINLF